MPLLLRLRDRFLDLEFVGVDGERFGVCYSFAANNERKLELFLPLRFRRHCLSNQNKERVSVDVFDSDQWMSRGVGSGCETLTEILGVS